MWRCALTEPPPVGDIWGTLSDDVPVTLDDGTESVGYYDYVRREWSAVNAHGEWTTPMDVAMWFDDIN